jgi:MFS family permease
MKEKGTFHFGWVIVAISFVTLALAYGVWYSFSVFFVALLKEFGWTRSLAAGAFSLFVVLHSLTGLFVGIMVDRIGPRRVILLGSFFLGVGLALCSFIKTWWQFYIFFGVITAVGVGSIGWVPNTTIVQHWFKEKRGLPIGIISSGIGIGILVCIPSIQHLITRIGWRMTYRVMAIFIPLIVISMAIAFLKRPPQTTRFRYIKEGVSPPVIKDPLVVNEEWAARSWTIREAIATKPFWLLSLSLFLGNLIAQSTFAHQVVFFVDHGLEALFASYIVGFIGIVSLGSKILWGALSDKIGREITYTIGITCLIFGMVTLILFSIFPSPGLTYFYSLFFGMGYAATAALPPLITADFFEGKAYGGIFGSLMIFVGAGGAFGVWFAGFVYDQVGSYVPVFIILILCALFSCLNIWRAAPRKIRMVPGKGFKIIRKGFSKGGEDVSGKRD